MNKSFIIFLVLLFVTGSDFLFAQIKGEQPPEFNPDTVFIFESPRPLLNSDRSFTEKNNAWGIDLLLSGNGFGMGVFMQKDLSDVITGFCSIYISGARNTDEIPVYDNYRSEWRVPNKINRLFMFPISLGIQHELFKNSLSQGFSPYLSIGVGPTFIVATPYEKDFFDSFGYASSYTRFGGFIGFGSNFSSSPTAMLGFNLRYYYIPFGGNGLASVKGHEIYNFGGVFLSLSLGTKY